MKQVLPKMEHIRGEKNLTYKKAEQLGAGGAIDDTDLEGPFQFQPPAQSPPAATLKKTPTTKVLTARGAELILAMAGQDALQFSGVSPVHSEPKVPMAGNQDAFELTGSLKRTPQIAMAGNQDALQLRSADRYDRDFQPPAQSPPETAFQKSDYRYDRDFQPPAPSPPEAALQKNDYRYDRDFQPPAPSPPETAFPKSDYRYNRQETTQTGRLFEDGELGKSAERHGHARRRRDRSPQLQGLHRSDIPLVSNFGSPGDRTPSAVERLWGFLHDQGQLLRTKGTFRLTTHSAGYLADPRLISTTFEGLRSKN